MQTAQMDLEKEGNYHFYLCAKTPLSFLPHCVCVVCVGQQDTRAKRLSMRKVSILSN